MRTQKYKQHIRPIINQVKTRDRERRGKPESGKDNSVEFNRKRRSKSKMYSHFIQRRNLTDDCQNVVLKGLPDVRRYLKII